MLRQGREIAVFQEKIIDWYAVHKRDLPWRYTSDPYHILVSEVMLQQTQVQRVIPKYEAWLMQFPTLQALAKASTSDVLRLWSGLGYNRRALYLQKTAQKVVSQYKGKFPEDEKELLDLPGIGVYTARAVLSFAFGKHVAVVDTNIRKIILIEFLKKTDAPTGEIAQWAQRLLPDEAVITSREWNQALMDYVAIELKNQKVAILKQTPFYGSNRFYRGRITRLLLATSPVALEDLGSIIKPDFSEQDREWLFALVAGLEKDGLVRYDGKQISITKSR